MSAMVTLEIPHINVMSKMDLVSSELTESAELDRYFDPDSSLLLEDLNSRTRTKFRALNEALARMVCSLLIVRLMNITWYLSSP